ncbi:MAG: TfoX/Sxy family protein [Parvularculaceae bacterium]|nr:TfoX/Sxy family protein [Parvularculaceae bacterium]
MAVSAKSIDRAKELFAPFGDIRVRKMFGGAGVYCDELFFAIMDEDSIYLKVDEETRDVFEARGLAPFVFEMKDGSSASMNYYHAPDDIYDDEDELKRWTLLALDAAARAARFKKKPAKKRAAKKR